MCIVPLFEDLESDPGQLPNRGSPIGSGTSTRERPANLTSRALAWGNHWMIALAGYGLKQSELKVNHGQPHIPKKYAGHHPKPLCWETNFFHNISMFWTWMNTKTFSSRTQRWSQDWAPRNKLSPSELLAQASPFHRPSLKFVGCSKLMTSQNPTVELVEGKFTGTFYSKVRLKILMFPAGFPLNQSNQSIECSSHLLIHFCW